MKKAMGICLLFILSVCLVCGVFASGQTAGPDGEKALVVLADSLKANGSGIQRGQVKATYENTLNGKLMLAVPIITNDIAFEDKAASIDDLISKFIGCEIIYTPKGYTPALRAEMSYTAGTYHFEDLSAEMGNEKFQDIFNLVNELSDKYKINKSKIVLTENFAFFEKDKKVLALYCKCKVDEKNFVTIAEAQYALNKIIEENKSRNNSSNPSMGIDESDYVNTDAFRETYLKGYKFPVTILIVIFAAVISVAAGVISFVVLRKKNLSGNYK